METKYMGMTTLPRELEEALVGLPHGQLLKLLRAKTLIAATDTPYTAIQELAKVYTAEELTKAVAKLPPPGDDPEPSTRAEASPGEPRPARVKAAPNPLAHPQPVINEKSAAIKAAGGSIGYDRAAGGWPLVSVDGRKQVLTSAVFRDSTIDQLLQMMK